jgi:hypothetical protein
VTTRDELLAEADAALAPIKELRIKSAMGMAEQVNVPWLMLLIEYAKVRALSAIAASGCPVDGELLEAVDSGTRLPTMPAPPDRPANGGGLVLPS